MREEKGKVGANHDSPIQTIFEDNDLIIIDKPWGIVVNNSQTAVSNTIQNWLAPKLDLSTPGLEFSEKGGIVHRLDKDTSGVMVLAKNANAYDKLKLQFLERKVIKKYIALVHGSFKDDSGLISAPIQRHPKDRHKFTIGGDLSRTSITEWKVLSVLNAQYSVLELTPHTGRTHQLRVHLQSINHPIVSDPIYGWQKRIQDDLAICPRLFLHAKYLEFLHPTTNQKISFEVELPEALQKMLH